jgi:hypothetical protein
MKLLERPRNEESYTARGFASRRRTIKGDRDIQYWNEIMSEFFSIRWVIPWWRLTSMTASRTSVPYLQLPGLRFASFVFPDRLLRQYGRKQLIPSRDSTPPRVTEMTQGLLSNWFRFWDARATWPIRSVPETTAVSVEYQRWMICPDAAERDSLRCREKNSEFGAKEFNAARASVFSRLREIKGNPPETCKGGSSQTHKKRKPDRDDPPGPSKTRLASKVVRA